MTTSGMTIKLKSQKLNNKEVQKEKKNRNRSPFEVVFCATDFHDDADSFLICINLAHHE